MYEEAIASRCGASLFSARETMLPLWDAGLVGKRLVRAFVTLDRLPPLCGPRKPGGHWPCTLIECADQPAQAELATQPSAAEITRMETAFGWLSELNFEDSGMALVITLWALRTARRRSIKKLCVEKHWAPYTFFRKRNKALSILVQLLNARGVPVS